MSGSSRNLFAALLAPLVLLVWFRWPSPSGAYSAAETFGQIVSAFGLFFAARSLSEMVASAIGTPSAIHRLGLVFVFATILSFSVRFGLYVSDIGSNPLKIAPVNGFGDAFWCMAAVALSMIRPTTRAQPLIDR